MRVMLVSREFDVPAYPLGRRTAVWKAALWGGICGTLPDLDALIEQSADGVMMLNGILRALLADRQTAS